MLDERTADLFREAYRLVDDPLRRSELLRDLAWVIGPDRARQSELESMFEEPIEALNRLEGTRGLSLRLQAAHLTGTILDGDQESLVGGLPVSSSSMDPIRPKER